MLTEIRFQNFRCFEDHTVALRPCTVIVGKNNAGKSTLVEGLRLVALAAARIVTMALQDPPAWTGLPRRIVGVSPSLDVIEFNDNNIFHRYGNPPAVIIARFDNNAELMVCIGAEKKFFAALKDSQGNSVKTRARAREILSERVEIMPQVAPVDKEEQLLSAEHIRRSLSSPLAPKHFRNQIYHLNTHFDRFQEISDQTWSGLHVQELLIEGDPGKRFLQLMVRNDDFSAEVATMGHGLQMWLQTMWFLARAEEGSTLILDEPDVYMHPDLQRRLIRFLRGKAKQVIITSHSVEIMSEVEPENILVLDRRATHSGFTSSFPAVQRVLDNVGSAHNLQLARLWHAKRSLLVEGKDFRLLSDFFDVLFPDDPDGLAIVPNLSIGGWNGMPYAIGTAMFLKNAANDEIAVYCILDGDYHTPEQKNKRHELAAKNGVRLHIWQRKEIENYLLDPRAIRRAVQKNAAQRVSLPTEMEIAEKLQAIVESMHDIVFDAFAGEFLLDNKSLGLSKANVAAREYINERWTTAESKLALVSGKSVLSQLTRWVQEQFAVSLTPALIARSFHAIEMPTELTLVIKSIAGGNTFSPNIIPK